MNKKIQFAIFMVSIFLGSACNSVYKKHYSNGYTFLKRGHQSKIHAANEGNLAQQPGVEVLSNQIKKEKAVEVRKAERSFETIHRKINQANEGQRNTVERKKKITASSGHHKPAISGQNNLKNESVTNNGLAVNSKSQLFVAGGLPDINTNKLDPEIEALAEKSLLLAIISIGSFFLSGLFSLIAFLPLSGLLGIASLVLAIVSLVLAKRAKRLAELNGFSVPAQVTTAKVLSWIVIGLNILAFLLLILLVILILLVAFTI